MCYETDKYKQLAGSILHKNEAQKVLCDDLHFDLLEIEPETLLDKTLFGFFEGCFIINQVLTKYGYFLKFFERRNVHRFLI